MLCFICVGPIERTVAELPPSCSEFDLSIFPKRALRNGLFSLRMQFEQIAVIIRGNSLGDRKVARKIVVLGRQSDKALDQALRAVDAFPSPIVSCPDETICRRVELDEERERIILSARKLADVSIRLVQRFPKLLGQDSVFVLELIESRFNAFLDGIDFLPPWTFICPEGNFPREEAPQGCEL